MNIYAHLITLPRHFANPAAICGVLLGCALLGEWSWLTVIVVLSGLCLAWWSHSLNTLLDYSWTKFDLGSPEARSKPKEYTSGSQVIARGIMGPKEVFANALGWLVLSAVLAVVIHIYSSPWIWLPWVLVAVCTFGYSWGKLHYCCELFLGLGFGSFAVMFGATSGVGFEPTTFGVAFLAGLPFTILWGYAAETVDQWTDAERDVPKGLKNMGALVWKNNLSISSFFGWLIVMTYLVQLFLVMGGVLSWVSGISMFAFPLFAYCLLTIERQMKVGILFGLLAIFLHMILLVVGQAIG